MTNASASARAFPRSLPAPARAGANPCARLWRWATRAGSNGSFTPGTTRRITQLVVDVGDRAAGWRTAASEAERAFARWQGAGASDRAHAAVAYLAAIDREEKAATDYGRAWQACCMSSPR